MRKLLTIFLSLPLITCLLSAQIYQSTPLKSLGRGGLDNGDTVAIGINDSGTIVGTSQLPNGDRHACTWLPSGAITDLGTLGGSYGVALGINKKGQVVGSSSTAGEAEYRAFLWTKSGGMKALPSLGSGAQDTANAINSSGAVVGYSCLGSECTGNYHAFLWTQSGGTQDLGTLSGGTDTFANGINSANHVVGTVAFADGTGHAFLWTQANGMQELAPSSGIANYAAGAINDSDEVVGNFLNTADNEFHGFSWTQAGGIQDLGTLESGSSEASAINNSGTIVGFGNNSAQTNSFALIWTSGGGIQNLGSLAGIDLVGAAGVNSLGQISANGAKPEFLNPSSVKVSRSEINFASEPVGETSPKKTITLTNVGTTSLTIDSIKIVGKNPHDFLQTNSCGSSLAPSAKCIIRVTFTPGAKGSRSAVIKVSDSDPTGPQQISLTGIGS
jgi:probable HAF family extracellular repeat protein